MFEELITSVFYDVLKIECRDINEVKYISVKEAGSMALKRKHCLIMFKMAMCPKKAYVLIT